jgi:hypothetical protein
LLLRGLLVDSSAPNVINNAVGHAKFFSRSHDAVIRVYDGAGKVIETHEHKGDFYFSEHGRQPQSSLHGLDTFGERGAVLESAAIRGQNRGCVWEDYPVSGETGNHCHKRLANYYQVMRLLEQAIMTRLH